MDGMTYPNPLQENPAYSYVEQFFVHLDDVVPKDIVVRMNSPRGIHFRHAGPWEKVCFEPDGVRACIVTCGGLCPGLNTVICEIVCSLQNMYGVTDVLGIVGGYKGFYSHNTIPLNPKVVNDIHKRGGTILGTSWGGHVTSKIVDSIHDRGINQVYIHGGDGTQRGATVIYEEIRRRGMKVAVAGIPKAVDNDIAIIDKSFGFDTAVEEAQRAINAAHVEAQSLELEVYRPNLHGSCDFEQCIRQCLLFSSSPKCYSWSYGRLHWFYCWFREWQTCLYIKCSYYRDLEASQHHIPYVGKVALLYKPTQFPKVRRGYEIQEGKRINQNATRT